MLALLPPPLRAAAGIAGAVADRAADAALTVSAAVLPRLLGIAAPATAVLRNAATAATHHLGRETDAERVVHVWPAGTTTPAAAHATADDLLTEPTAPTGKVDSQDLPIRNWDQLTIAAARQRIRNLGADDVALLLAYERDHAARPAVLLALERRLSRIAETASGV